MKLNLIPPKQKKEGGSWGIPVGVLLLVVGVLVALYLIGSSTAAENAARAKVEARQPEAQRVVTFANSAEQTIQLATPFTINYQLAQEMNKATLAYPDLFDDIRPYIPSFFRVTSISAAPFEGQPDQFAEVRITGVIASFQQYTNLLLALLQYPNAVSVIPSTYASPAPFRPNVTEDRQNPQMGWPGARSLEGVQDPLQRLEIIQFNQSLAPAAPRLTYSFINVGNFGTDNPGPKGPMPGYSEVTIQLYVMADLRVPDPRATLTTAARGAQAGAQQVQGGGGFQPGGGEFEPGGFDPEAGGAQ